MKIDPQLEMDSLNCRNQPKISTNASFGTVLTPMIQKMLETKQFLVERRENSTVSLMYSLLKIVEGTIVGSYHHRGVITKITMTMMTKCI
jgi:hypothetical protein